MEFEMWHLAVLAAVVTLIGWGLRVSPRPVMAGLAATSLLISGFLLYTLVLEEENIELDLNGKIDTVALIGIPALLGVGLAVLAARRPRSRQG